MYKIRKEEERTMRGDYKYAVQSNNSFSYFKSLETARKSALDILKKHPGYVVTIFKIEGVKKELLPGFVKVSMKSVSTLQF